MAIRTPITAKAARRKLLTVNEKLYNDAVRHAVFLERLKTQQANAIVGMLNRDVYPDILAKIEARLANIGARGFDVGAHSSERLRSLYSSIKGLVDGGMEAGYGLAKDGLREAARVEAASQVAIINRNLPEVFSARASFVMPSGNLLNSIVTERPFQGALLKDWFDNIAASTQTKLESSLNIGLAQGESVQDLVTRVRGTAANNFADGVLNASRRDVESVVRTAISHVVTQARESTYEENSDLVDSVKFVATLDTRTTPQCRALDGKVFPINEGPRPPVHFGCRSTTVPVLKSWKALGFNLKDVDAPSRASMNGQVPADITYGEWLKGQSHDVQNEVLGPSRAGMFRSGEVPIDRFVDNRGNTLTLDQLRVKEGLPIPSPAKAPEVPTPVVVAPPTPPAPKPVPVAISEMPYDLKLGVSQRVLDDTLRVSGSGLDANQVAGTLVPQHGGYFKKARVGTAEAHDPTDGDSIVRGIRVSAKATDGDKFVGTVERTLYLRSNGDVVVHNDYFELDKAYKGGGLGFKLFESQVNQCRAAGIDLFEVEAAGEVGSSFNGYNTWARFGYDGDLPDNFLYRIKGTPFEGAKRIKDIMSTPEGRALWKEHGSAFLGEFDLSDGSYSMRTLQAYKDAKLEAHKPT